MLCELHLYNIKRIKFDFFLIIKMDKLIYFINSQKNRNDIWQFIDVEYPPRCGWNAMFGFEELDIIRNFLEVNNYNENLPEVIDYLKAYRLLNISYEDYNNNKKKYITIVFNYYYNNSYSKI